MADFAHRKTDALLAGIEKDIAEIYAAASRDLNEKVIAYFAKFVKRDEEMRKKVENGEVSEYDYQQWRLAQMGRGERFQTMRDDYSKRVNEANQAAAAYINDNTPGIYSLNRNYAAYTIEQVCGDVGFTLCDEQTIRRLIVDKPDLFPAPRVDIPVDLRWNKQKLTAELTSGILQGESIGKLADRFQQVTDMNRTSAVRNARTAVTGAQNAGRQASYDRAQEMNLPLRKRWVATKDGRTRHDHRRADGQTVALNEPFTVGGDKLMHPGDTSGSPANVYNCRCTMRTVEKEGIEAEPRMMRVKNPETGKYELISEMTYDEWERWKKGQVSTSVEAQQKSIDAVFSPNESGSAPQPFEIDIENEKYSAFLQNAPEKSRIYLSQTFSTVSYTERKMKGSAFGYSEKDDCIYYDPTSPDIKAIDYTVVNTHELSHRIDAMFVRSWESKSFEVAIDDAKQLVLVARGEIERFCWSEERIPFISDIFSAISDDELELPYFHDAEYWRDKGKCKDIFANLYSLEAFGAQEEMEFLQKYVPELFAEYLRLTELL